MDVITVDGKQYDPYFILDVTRDDTDKHISKSFREKVKKYHPDKYTEKKKKRKYEQYFKILSESYRYIQDRKSNSSDLRNNYKKNKKTQNEEKNKKTKKTHKDFEELNEKCDKKIKNTNPNDFGYGDNYKRLGQIEDYEKENLNICKQFGKKKFSLNEFNKMFEYNNSLNPISNELTTSSKLNNLVCILTLILLKNVID